MKTRIFVLVVVYNAQPKGAEGGRDELELWSSLIVLLPTSTPSPSLPSNPYTSNPAFIAYALTYRLDPTFAFEAALLLPSRFRQKKKRSSTDAAPSSPSRSFNSSFSLLQEHDLTLLSASYTAHLLFSLSPKCPSSRSPLQPFPKRSLPTLKRTTRSSLVHELPWAQQEEGTGSSSW